MEKPCAVAHVGDRLAGKLLSGEKDTGLWGQVECKLVVLPDSRERQQWMLQIEQPEGPGK